MHVKQQRRRLVSRFQPSMLDETEMHARVTYKPPSAPHLLHPEADLFLAPGPLRYLAIDGVWQVPPEQRPEGWQTMGVREQ